ncbi:MAG: DUF4179 domain-containing protein [Rubrobacteridae bacterium]|nr:DUF4179 domain-containing protein [Rubrobacteridae bacterium]
MPDKTTTGKNDGRNAGLHIFALPVLTVFTLLIISIILSSCALFMPTHTLNSSKTFGFNDNGLLSARAAGLVDKIDKTVTVNGKSITLTEAYYDKSRIILNVSGRYESISVNDLDFELSHNGKPVGLGWSKNEQSASIMADDVSELPAKINLQLLVKEKYDSKRIFKFDIQLDRTEADKRTKQFTINKEQRSGTLSVAIKTIMFTPSSVAINYDYEGSANDKGYYIKLAEQNDGNEDNTSSDIVENLTGDRISGTGKVMFATISPVPAGLNLMFYKINSSNSASSQDDVIMKMYVDIPK